MNRILLTVAIAMISLSVSAGHHEKGPSFNTVKVSPAIDMLSGKGGNIAVLKAAEGVLLVDDDYADMSSALEKALSAYGGTNQVAYLINTHWHGDHTGGNAMLGREAVIVAHDNVRKRLSTDQEVKLFKMKSGPYPEVALPKITYSRDMTLHFGGETVELVHFPNGHTDSDTVVFFKKANVVHMGDHFFNGGFPFVDVDSQGNVVHVAKNLKRILHKINGDTKIIPGHGPLASKADLVSYRNMLIGTTAEVRALRAAGMSLEQIKEKGLSAHWDEWDNKFVDAANWITIIHASLEAQERRGHKKGCHHKKGGGHAGHGDHPKQCKH